MKRNNDYHYPGINSFEDLRLERARLILKSRLIETKINIEIAQLRETFSISTLLLSVASSFIPEGIYAILESILKK